MGSERAVWFAAPGQVEVRPASAAPAAAGEISVETEVSAISPGTEVLVLDGQVPPGLALDLPTLEGSFGLPIKYGYAAVGAVTEAGPGARLQVGQRVFVRHPHQSRFTVAEELAVALPPELEPEQAAFLANVETAINVVLDARAQLGDRALVFGQGVVGLLLTQLLKRAGCAAVGTIDPLPARRALSAELGADAVAEPSEGLRLAADIGGGGPPDLIVEASGNPEALATAVEAAGEEGTVVVCSWYGQKPVQLQLGGAFHRRRLRLVSSQVGRLDPALGPSWDRERRTRLALDLLPVLQLEPLVSHRFPVDQAADAYALLRTRSQAALQILFTYPRDV